MGHSIPTRPSATNRAPVKLLLRSHRADVADLTNGFVELAQIDAPANGTGLAPQRSHADVLQAAVAVFGEEIEQSADSPAKLTMSESTFEQPAPIETAGIDLGSASAISMRL